MTASTLPSPPIPRTAFAAVAVWLGLAVLVSATGFLASLPFPGPQVIILTLFAGTLVAVTSVSTVRAWVDALPLRILIGVNGLRFIGIAFLALAARGRLDPVFAARAGWGDIAVASVAIVLVATGIDLRTRLQRGFVHVWNAFGFLDLVVAVATATAVTLRATTPGVVPVLSFPLGIVPTFFVPIFVANHVVIFRRLLARGRAANGG
jgi:hypothetical protein